ncbi:bromodomain-containing protein 7 isoform X1 [Pimephales promelas]|uniref:bromodomain-containing protein 7 isoform X1 n=1 Tax=Pimephales promelas TaxID=90988 RepID=UPI001955B693|nr:bromodomain-containing protein 7 isoform X1 [Pimephales promelas]KAG1955602.1 bromodomain-containing protein [Pimephales promelas]
MGKKHKKHKSEKHTHDEFTERPLKLVLKVAGNEVTTGSPSLESVHDDQVDYDKHNKKKKKKKKDEKDRASPPVSPADKKKKMTKKRKGTDSVDPDWDEQSRTPARSDVSQDKPLTLSLARMEEKEQTPLQEALSQLIRQLQRKDPSAFFSFPVTDLIAPGYSLIIKRPMDFSTMKEKVKREQYQSLEELKLDFRVMCENAMIYNKPETIFYKAAKKLLHSGMKILSTERLDSLKQSIEFMAGLQTSSSRSAEDGDEDGGTSDAAKENSSVMDTSDNSQSPRVGNKDTPRDSKEDAQKSQAEKDLEEIKKIVEDSGGKLSNRRLQSELEFERRTPDGSTTLGILNPADLSPGDPGYCPVKLGMMGGRLQSGINTLQGFKEDKRNMLTPVAYMNYLYGPFSSYAPTYDSSFANISKEDSDLIYSFYGEDSTQPESESIADFLAKSEEHMSRLADNILDALTSGEHSKQLKETATDNLLIEEPAEKADTTDDAEVVASDPSSGDSVTALSSVGLNPDLLPESLNTEEAEHFQQKLDETTVLLRELEKVQKERLSAKQPPNIICLLVPTAKELQLAEKVTGNLAQLTSQVTPGDVCSVYGIRKAMGVSLPNDTAQDTFTHLTTVGDIIEPMEGVC